MVVLSGILTGIGVGASVIGAIPKILPLVAIAMLATGHGEILGGIAGNVLNAVKDILAGLGAGETEEQKNERQISGMGYFSEHEDGQLLDGAMNPNEAIDKSMEGVNKTSFQQLQGSVKEGDWEGAARSALESNIITGGAARIIRGANTLVNGSDIGKDVAKGISANGITLPDGSDATEKVASIWRESEYEARHSEKYAGLKGVGRQAASFMSILTTGREDSGLLKDTEEIFKGKMAKEVQNGGLVYNVDIANEKAVVNNAVEDIVHDNDRPLSDPTNREHIRNKILDAGIEVAPGEDKYAMVQKALNIAENDSRIAVNTPEGLTYEKNFHGDAEKEINTKTEVINDALEQVGIKFNLNNIYQSVGEETTERSLESTPADISESTDQLLNAGQNAAKDVTQKGLEAGKEATKSATENDKKETKDTEKQSPADEMSR